MIKALLLDRDGTLVRDVPYNGDSHRVQPLPGVTRLLTAARRAGLLLGVVTNQSGVGRGLVTATQMGSVNAAIEHQLGTFDTWQICPHHPLDDCPCRKPGPGLIHQAAADLGVNVTECLVIGDRATDLTAGRAAGASALAARRPSAAGWRERSAIAPP